MTLITVSDNGDDTSPKTVLHMFAPPIQKEERGQACG